MTCDLGVDLSKHPLVQFEVYCIISHAGETLLTFKCINAFMFISCGKKYRQSSQSFTTVVHRIIVNQDRDLHQIYLILYFYQCNRKEKIVYN